MDSRRWTSEQLRPGAHEIHRIYCCIYAPNEASNVRAVGTSAGSREPRTRDRPAAAATAAHPYNAL